MGSLCLLYIGQRPATRPGSLRQLIERPSPRLAPPFDSAPIASASATACPFIGAPTALSQAGGTSRTWNRLFNRTQALHLILRERPDGRDGISALMASDMDTVRMSAAARSLSWDKARARQVLSELRAGPGLAAVDAKWTLREFDRGRLNATWEPRRG